MFFYFDAVNNYKFLPQNQIGDDLKIFFEGDIKFYLPGVEDNENFDEVLIYDATQNGAIFVKINAENIPNNTTITTAHAQFAGGASGQAGFTSFPIPNTPPQNNIPIDGGLSILAALGLGYGVYTNRKRK